MEFDFWGVRMGGGRVCSFSVSRGRCGCDITWLRRLAAVVSASILRYYQQVLNVGA